MHECFNVLKLRFSIVILLAIGILISCEKETFPPVAEFEASAGKGFTGRVFTFDASESSDPDGDPLTLKCRWDFNSDGQWDTEYNISRIAHHIFTETGLAKIRLEVLDADGLTDSNTDSVYLYEPIPDTLFTDIRDNQQYRAVLLGGKWWMAENLRFGTRIHSSELQSDNGVIEYFAFDNNPANVAVHGGLYNWEEMMNYQVDTINQGICPEGWRIPTVNDWESINLAAPLQFVIDYYGPDGISGFNLQFSGIHETSAPKPPFVESFGGLNFHGYYWTTERHKFMWKNTPVTLYKAMHIAILSSPELQFGFFISTLGDFYLQTYLDSVYYNIPSISLRCIKD
jgi:hypothetical protein